MKLTWKNGVHNAFRIVAFLHICTAARGQLTNVTTPNMTTQATTTVQAPTSKRGTSQKPTETTITSPTTSPTTMATTSSMTVTSESSSEKVTTVTTIGNRSSDAASTTEDRPSSSMTLSTLRKSTTTPKPTNDYTSTIIIIIVLVAAIIVIFIAIVTAAYLCCCKENRGDPKGYSSPESNGKVNGATKDQLPSGHPRSNEINEYERVNEYEQVEKSHPSVDKPSVTDPNCYSNEGLTGDNGKGYVTTSSDERSSLAEKSKANTGNIFDDIDPTTEKFKEQIELSPSESSPASTSEDQRISEAPSSGTGQITDKGRETVTPPKPVVRRNISNRNEDITKLRPKPQPRVRPVSRALQDGADTVKDNTSPGNEPRDLSTSADPPSSTSHQEKQRMFRPPLKGKGPDGSDQAALLANVLRKSNTPRQIEEDNSAQEKEEGTTYW